MTIQVGYESTTNRFIPMISLNNMRRILRQIPVTKTPHLLSERLNRSLGIFGYLAEGRLQFGALSTYINTWFLQRPKDTPDRLRISNGILSYATDPSFLQSYAYVISLAMKNPESPSPIASPTQTHQKPFIDDSSDYSSDHTDRTTYLPSSSYQTSSTEKTSGTSMNLRTRQSQALQHSNWDTFHLWM